MTIQHILVPVDFSESTNGTVRFARELAERFSARVTLYHVFHIVMTPLNEVPTDLERWSEDRERAAEARLKELAASMGSGVQVETAAEDGVPWDNIVKRAAKFGHDHIVMGIHGHTGLKHVLLGSVAERVVRHAPCSVTIVRKRHADGA